MAIQPLNGNVLVRPTEAHSRTSGGLYVPDSAREAATDGIVEAKAAGGSAQVAIGDRVIFREGAGETLSLDGVEYRLIPEGDLLAKYVLADAIAAE